MAVGASPVAVTKKYSLWAFTWQGVPTILFNIKTKQLPIPHSSQAIAVFPFLSSICLRIPRS